MYGCKTSRKEVELTRNQIYYWQNVETKRSNLARENETHRNNAAVEAETNRHNLAMELLTKNQYEELARHNLANEIETNRTNIANEGIKQVTNDIGYGNLAVKQYEAKTGRLNAATNQQNADTNAFLASETQRHNMASEDINLLNLAQTKELEQQRIDNTFMSITEQQRHNMEQESIDKDRVANQAKEVANENARIIEQTRSNLAKEQETNRHNQALEFGQNYRNLTGGTRDLLNIGNDTLNSVSNVIRSINPISLIKGGAQ